MGTWSGSITFSSAWLRPFNSCSLSHLRITLTFGGCGTFDLGTGTCNLFLSSWGGDGEPMQASPAAELPFGTQLQPLPGCFVHTRPLFQLAQ